MNPCPPFVTVGMLIELLPQYASGHVYRLNSKGAGRRRLPAYDLDLGSGLWALTTIREWADQFNVVLDPVVLERIEKDQTV